MREAFSKPSWGSAQATLMWLTSPQQPADQRVTMSGPLTSARMRLRTPGRSAEICMPPMLSRWTA